ncbi:hypothetical protein Ddye_004754 [Dipteronia dyeriana]|uniref:Uncharacterized protein n=1 Tax=Dipteronia dyeriana TaxID=168575 RepID=A0AAD9XFG1_9ROSI|nr:hypothetical protein Ddye_004754 [Dipteronia dyeriana]
MLLDILNEAVAPLRRRRRRRHHLSFATQPWTRHYPPPIMMKMRQLQRRCWVSVAATEGDEGGRSEFIEERDEVVERDFESLLGRD